MKIYIRLKYWFVKRSTDECVFKHKSFNITKIRVKM